MKYIPGDENIIEGITSNDEWRTAFLRLIADTWEGRQPDIYDLGYEEVRKLLDQYGFEVPPNLRIKIIPFKGEARYNHNAEMRDKENGWFQVLTEEKLGPDGTLERAYYSTVEMMIPPTPVEKYQASALASFMATGKAYPFTIG